MRVLHELLSRASRPDHPYLRHIPSKSSFSDATHRVIRNADQIHRFPSFFSPWPCLGWSGGAKVLGNLPVPGRPTNLDYRRARA